MAMANPFSGFPVTDDWAAHRARGSLGGTDYGTPVGTPIRAPQPGRVTYEAGNGSGGYIITLAMANNPGYRMQFLHCSAFEGSQRDVNEGDVLGYTGGAAGAPGAGSSTGAHVHVHLVDPNGVREDVQPWFADAAPSGGGSVAPAGVDYSEVQTLLQGRGYYSGSIDGQFGPQSWTAVQTLCADYGFMDANYIDGIPGKKTYTGMQLYAQKNDNYRGKIDGLVGPNTWAGFTQSLREDAPKPVAPVVVPPAPAKPVPAKPKPVKPASVTKPSAQIPKPVKEKPMATTKPTPEEIAAQQASIAGVPHADLGVIIPTASGRKWAYFGYALLSMIVSNTAVGFAAAGASFPVGLTVALAIVANLAPAFSAIAIGNVKK